ncbi:hypothetical protein CP973_20575 [Streptomyces albofaciens JCM 4342]|uniref:hypothetical protein n=1 Tax=Streptomyces albofaciens TaxID=66866 RepID=UPI00123BB422|nr:hypothetical protein [Streptomyces albofaciens]KAA6223993.1 hypothetical protein CP973_20575 [Streptomyces albofaciens JCM 4342]
MKFSATRGGLFTRGAMLVASVTAGAVLATATGAQAAQTTPHQPTDRIAAVQLADQDGFTAGELEQGKTLADGIAELGISESQFAKALDIALTRTIDTHGLRERLAALPASPTARQTAEAAYPGDAEAQAAMLPVLANEKVRYTTLQNLGAQSGEKAPAVAFGWWDKTKFIVGCAAAVAGVLISFVPAGSGVRVARAVKLFKSYGAKKTAEILWRFMKGKHVGSKEREAVKAFIGISAIQKACT